MVTEKRILIGVAAVLLLSMVLASCTNYVLKGPQTSEERAFLAGLQGEIVYAHRDGEIENIYKINANGTDKKLLYHNDRPEYNQNSFDPRWSEDGTKIFFATRNIVLWIILAVITLGYPDESPPQKTRKPLSEIAHYERF